jgi:capsular exopolysaccharide synthesis family protein
MTTMQTSLPGSNNYFVQEAYKFLRANIQFCGPDIKVIVLTSCEENEGKTTVSMSLAKSFAEIGKKVLLIDADMRKSVLAGRNLDAKDYRGLSEYLSGMCEVGEVVMKTSVKDMYVLLAGKYPPNPSELLNGRLFDSLIKVCRENFDYVIIDTPPLGAVSDAAVVAPKCDGSILVIGDEKLSYSLATDVVDKLRATGTPILGAVRNNSKTGGKKYYRDKKYYRYSSKYYGK